MGKTKNSSTPKLILSDTGKKQKKTVAKEKLTGLVGKSFDNLKAGEKDVLIKLLLEKSELINASGTVI
jgi:hypothetical protein